MRMPAARQEAIASGTSRRTGSCIPTRPRKVNLASASSWLRRETLLSFSASATTRNPPVPVSVLKIAARRLLVSGFAASPTSTVVHTSSTDSGAPLTVTHRRRPRLTVTTFAGAPNRSCTRRPASAPREGLPRRHHGLAPPRPAPDRAGHRRRQGHRLRHRCRRPRL